MTDGKLLSGQSLLPEETLVSVGGQARLHNQNDGNLVVYLSGPPFWASQTAGQAAGILKMRADGDLVLTGPDGRGRAHTGTAGHPGAMVQLQDDGNFVLYEDPNGPLAGTPIWASSTGAFVIEEVEPEPVPSTTALRVESNKRWFANDAGRFDFREATMFALLALWISGRRAEAMAVIDQALAERFNVMRVIITLDGDYWINTARQLTGRSLRCAPDMPGYEDGLMELVRYLAGRGAYIRVVMIGAVEPFGGVWYPDRRDVWVGTSVQTKGEAFQRRITTLLKDEPNVLLEQANEPEQIGLRHSADVQVRLSRELKQIAPNRMLNGGAVDGSSDQGIMYAVKPYDFVDAHIDRRQGVGGMEWVKRTGEYTLIDQPQNPPGIIEMPFVSGEPINFGDWRLDGRNDDVERSPSVAFAYGACSRSRKYNTCFHFDRGLWGMPMEQATLDCARAYHAGLDAFPMLTDNKWRGGWALEQGNYWKRDIWPAEDGIEFVEAHVKAGKSPWRVFGCGAYSMTIAEPKNWNWQANVVVEGVERIAFCDNGVFNSAVYVKR